MARIELNKPWKRRGGKHRKTRVKTEKIIVETDPEKRLREGAGALADVLRARVKREKRRVKPATVERRQRAFASSQGKISKGFPEGAPATKRRYKRRTPTIVSADRWLNDSGGLLESLIHKPRKKKGKVAGWVIKAKVAKRARYLGQMHKAFDIKTAIQEPAVRRGLQDGLRRSIVKKRLR